MMLTCLERLIVKTLGRRLQSDRRSRICDFVEVFRHGLRIRGE